MSDTYTVPMSCGNCYWRGISEYPRGQRVPEPSTCPNCGCLELRRSYPQTGRKGYDLVAFTPWSIRGPRPYTPTRRT